MRLTCRVLALTSGKHLTQNGFLDLGLVNTSPCHHGLDHCGPKVMRRGSGERPVEAAHGGASRRNDYDIGHLDLLPLRPRQYLQHQEIELL